MTKAILPKKTERQTACAHDVGAGLVYVGQQAGELHHQGDDQHCGHADGCKGCQIAANSDPQGVTIARDFAQIREVRSPAISAGAGDA